MIFFNNSKKFDFLTTTFNTETIYAVEQIDFDNSEKLFKKACHSEFLGYVEDENVAIKITEKLKKKLKKYKGWDNDCYPKFKIQIINKFKEQK